MDTKKMRACAPLLPEPGGQVVCECLDEIERLRTAQSELARYFTSGNSVPVERATILAKDFWRITGLTPNTN